MKQIIDEYGSAILIFVVVIALIAIMAWLVGSESSPVAEQFKGLIDSFFNKANTGI